MKETLVEREGGLEHAKRECLDRERWKLFCGGSLVGGWRGMRDNRHKSEKLVREDVNG